MRTLSGAPRMIASGSLAAVLGALALAGVAAASPSAQVALPQSAVRSLPGRALQATPADAPVEFSVSLRPSDTKGAEELARAVAEPGSAGYRHFLTPTEWESRYSPGRASVKAVTDWLKAGGAKVEGITPDRMTVTASAPASIVESLFSTRLAEYASHGRVVRLAAGSLSVPADLAGTITAVSGVDQRVMRPAALGAGRVGPAGAARRAADGEALAGSSEAAAVQTATKPIPPAEWPLTPEPCSGYWGEKLDLLDPAFGGGYTMSMPYGTCGYEPAQLQGAYDLDAPIASGDDGTGVTVAITDAYASPTLESDVARWGANNGDPLAPGQLTEDVSPKFNAESLCEASGWSIEQTLDVESVHAMAPGAHILYMGAKSCLGPLFGVVETVVDEHLADVISNSWTEYGSEELTPPGEFLAFDNVLLMAAGTGVGVQFSAGDEGDSFAPTGSDAPQYPPESPYATGVGGTSVEIGPADERELELGWSNSISSLCTATVAEHEEAVEFLTEQPIECTPKEYGKKWLPKAPGGYWAGGGGGTSYEYAEPYYQQGVVPKKLADRHRSATGTPNRVVPDISMDADPFTGLKVGETLEEPGGASFEEYPIGGTSLASPLLAGEIAVADQAAGGSLGFLNPLLYRLEADPSTSSVAFNDILAPPAKEAFAIENFVNESNAEEGLFTTVRTLGYEGKEAHCSEEGACVVRKTELKAAPGYDSMTGVGSPGTGFVEELARP